MDGIRMAGSAHLSLSAVRKKIREANPHTAAVPSRRPYSLAPQSGYGLNSRPSEARTSRNFPWNVWTVTPPIKVKHSWALTISRRLYQNYALLERRVKFCTRPEFFLKTQTYISAMNSRSDDHSTVTRIHVLSRVVNRFNSEFRIPFVLGENK